MKGQNKMTTKRPVILSTLICGLILGSVIGGSMPLNKFTIPLVCISPLVLAISFKLKDIGECNWKGQALIILLSTTVLMLSYCFISFSGEFYDYILNLLMERINQQ
uniref:Uncharacterized protein n=3 Tax=Bacillus cereus TaxID=1396 RepID=A1BZI1_BACCE|nr:hypothetical protein pPER272_AH820_0152 [Bacillus cereus]ABK01229.1 hypothetical protein pPER272_0152 [Bacillus cereus]